MEPGAYSLLRLNALAIVKAYEFVTGEVTTSEEELDRFCSDNAALVGEVLQVTRAGGIGEVDAYLDRLRIEKGGAGDETEESESERSKDT